jgi:hypothetical protein
VIKSIQKEYKLTIFANFLIDSDERLFRVKDSFNSFCGIMPDEWVINVRGSKNKEVAEFLAKNIKSCAHITIQEVQDNWFYTSKKQAQNITGDLVLFWIEDHILTASIAELERVLLEFNNTDTDQLIYSWHNDHSLKPYKFLGANQLGKSIDIWEISRKSGLEIQQHLNQDFYDVSATAVFKRAFFLKVLNSNKPYLKRWPRNTPFDFEKKSSDKFITKIYTAWPKNEMFASIDDDNGKHGYCLIARGLYPNRMSRIELVEQEKKGHTFFEAVKLKAKKLLSVRVASTAQFLYILIKRICYTFF